MGCLLDMNTAGFLTQPIQFCDLTVEAAAIGAPVRVQFTAQELGPANFGATDTFTGVITQVAADGTVYVVDLLGTVTVHVVPSSSGSVDSPGPSVPFSLQSQHALASQFAGKQLHVAVGPSSYFKYKQGDIFHADPTAMLRTTFTVPKAKASSSFTIAVGKLPGTVSPLNAPSATIEVSNLGSGSGVDAIAGVTMDPNTGQLVGNWTTADTPLIPPGETQPVTLKMTSAPGGQYAGKTLSAIFTDSHGNKAQGTFTVAGTGGSTQPGPGTSPSPTPSPTPAPGVSPWVIIAGAGVVVVGLGTLALGSRR